MAFQLSCLSSSTLFIWMSHVEKCTVIFSPLNIKISFSFSPILMYSLTFLWHVSWLKRHLSRRRKRHPSRCLAGPLAGQSADPKRHQLHWVLGQWKTRQKHRELARPKPLSCSSFYTSKLYHRTVGPVDFHRSRFSIWVQLHLKFLNFPDYLLQALFIPVF